MCTLELKLTCVLRCVAMSLDICTEISEDPAASTVRVEDYIALHSRRQDTNLRIEHPSNRNPSVWNYELTEPRRLSSSGTWGGRPAMCCVSYGAGGHGV